LGKVVNDPSVVGAKLEKSTVDKIVRPCLLPNLLPVEKHLHFEKLLGVFAEDVFLLCFSDVSALFDLWDRVVARVGRIARSAEPDQGVVSLSGAPRRHDRNFNDTVARFDEIFNKGR